MDNKSKTIQFMIVTPEKTVYDAQIKQVSLPTSMGEITVLLDHEPLVGIIAPGEISIKKEGEKTSSFLAVSEGFVEVNKNKVRVFASTAQRAEDLDEKAILKAKQEAEDAVKNKKNLSEIAFADASTRLKRELAKLKILERHRRKRY